MALTLTGFFLSGSESEESLESSLLLSTLAGAAAFTPALGAEAGLGPEARKK